jgi:DNA-binding beta-propeller fold protein YncE
MQYRWTFSAAIPLLLISLAGCGGMTGTNSNANNPLGNNPPAANPTSPPPEFLFASLPSSNSLAAFQIDTQTGALTRVPGSPFPATGKGPLGLAVHPSGKFLYGVNSASLNSTNDAGTISAYGIAQNGALSAIGGEVTSGSGIEPFAVAVHPTGTFLYTAAALSSVPAGYTIDSNTGTLTPMSTARADFQDLFDTGGIVVTSAFVYESFGNGIDAFPIGMNGMLTDTTSSPALLVGFGVGKMALGPGDKFIFAIGTGHETRPEPAVPGTLISVAISSTGTLSLLGTPLPFLDGSDIAVSGNFLFALNAVGVSVFAINPNSGALTQVQGSPFVINNQSGFIQVDASGKFLYVARLNSFAQPTIPSEIAAFSIDSAGALHAVTGSPFALTAPVGGLASAVAPLQ